jgi:hypothetical protein
MKLKIFLVISLCANLGLAAAFIFKGASSSSLLSPSFPQATSGSSSSVKNAETDKAAQEGAASAQAAAGISPNLWSKLYSKDMATFIANLRAAGIPPKMLRLLVSSELSEKYTAKRKELMGDEGAAPFWKMKNNNFGYNAMTKLQALYREQNEEFKQLLGADAKGSMEESAWYFRRTYGNLPADKIESLQKMSNDYSELRSQIYAESNGLLLPEDKEKLAMLEKENRADLVATLTPEELEEYDMRNSRTASRLRSQYSTFDFTEQEFRSAYALMKSFDDKYNSNIPGMQAYDATTAKARMAEEKQIQDQIKQMLGEQRYQEYQRAGDNTYRVASQLAERLQLPKENAVAVYDLKSSVETQSAAIRSNRSLSVEAKTQALKDLASDASAKLDQFLTSKGAEAFKTSGGGYWIQNLNRTPGTVTRSVMIGGTPVR